VRKTGTALQLAWGVALVLAGVGVFFRIPYVMPRVEKIEQFKQVLFFVRLSFYLLGVLLVAGGAKKIYDNYRNVEDGDRNA